MFTEWDVQCMRRALTLAERARGQTSPNPIVGAVVARRRKVVGEGYHKRAGTPHAEPLAIQDAGTAANGATLYVTLEPCSTHGRTPPCTEAILRAGIKHVVIATEDPNPKHDTRGIAILRRAGVRVRVGLCRDEAARLNPFYNKWITTGLPFVTIKAAMSLDGRIATRKGDSNWITGPLARAFGHQLRSQHDAILVGINTVLRDDPALTVRLATTIKRQPQRLVLDTSGRTPLNSQLLNDRLRHNTLIITTTRCSASKCEQFRSRGAQVLVAPLRGGVVDLRWTLRQLARREITSILVEGGGEVNASFLEHGMADRVAFFYAPKIIGSDGVSVVGGKGIGRVADALELKNLSVKKFGEDLLVTGDL